MCSFFLPERLRKDNEWFIAGTPAAHRLLVCVVWEHTSAQISCSCRPSYVENAFAPSPEYRMGCLWPAFSGVFFPILFPSVPYKVVFDFVPHLRGWAGRFNQIMDHMDLEHLRHVTHIVAVTEAPVTLSRSLQVAPYIQILKLGKHTLIANPIYWPHTLCSVDKKQDRKATGWAKDSPGGSELFREKSVLGKCFLMTLQIHRSSHLSYGMGPPLYFREHSHFSESWKSCLKPSKL